MEKQTLLIIGLVVIVIAVICIIAYYSDTPAAEALSDVADIIGDLADD